MTLVPRGVCAAWTIRFRTFSHAQCDSNPLESELFIIAPINLASSFLGLIRRPALSRSLSQLYAPVIYGCSLRRRGDFSANDRLGRFYKL